ncbi:oligosaccharide flippase family protein [candidate division KSB1 bacterium]|nr:oligosaccharide flippase family protein [candidate division KSB1 bacterium]
MDITPQTHSASFARKSYLKDTMQLGSGTALAQIATILSIPVLSRVFTPESFGIAALFSAIVIILSAISGLRYELAILLPEEEQDSFFIFILHFVITLFFGLFTGLFFWLGKGFIASLIKAPEIEKYLWLVGPAIIVFGILNGFNLWNTRQKKYKLISAGKLGGSTGTALIQLLFGLLGSTSATGLIGGSILGKALEDGIQGYPVVQKSLWKFKRPARHELKQLAGRYNKFPKFYCPSTLINNLSWQIPNFFLNFFFSPVIVGFYTLGDRIIRTPMNMIGQTVAQVFFQRGAEAYRNGSIKNLFLETVQMLILAGLFPILVLTVSGRELFFVILGEQWAEAGVYAQILAPFAFIRFLSSPLTHIFSIAEKQENSLKFNITNLIIRLIAMIIGGIFKNPILMLGLFSLSGFLTYTFLLFWLGKEIGLKTFVLVKIFTKFEVVLSIASALLLLIIKLFCSGSELISVIIAVVCIFFYYVYLSLRYKSLLGKE